LPKYLLKGNKVTDWQSHIKNVFKNDYESFYQFNFMRKSITVKAVFWQFKKKTPGFGVRKLFSYYQWDLFSDVVRVKILETFWLT